MPGVAPPRGEPVPAEGAGPPQVAAEGRRFRDLAALAAGFVGGAVLACRRAA